MRKNKSPWLHQLDPMRSITLLDTDLKTDVAIVGAGIAGTATAYFLLKYTNKRVAILERQKLAHGATGHNAGQIVSYFERGFASMVEEFGTKLAGDGQRAIDDAWELLDEMYTDASLDIPFSRFMGHDGLTSFDQIIWHLKNANARRAAGLRFPTMQVSAESDIAKNIPEEFDGLYTVSLHTDVLRTLETESAEYIAAISSQKGCINSALFCQEVILFLRKKYFDRFVLYEHAPVKKIILDEDSATLDVDTQVVTAKRVVLCTNGFEDIHILNHDLSIDTKYHELISGKIGYMSGYLEAMNKLPNALCYFDNPGVGLENSYFYLTRRPYEYEKGTQHNLISIGGPDIDIPEKSPYSYADEYPEAMTEKIDAFIKKTYDRDPNRKIDFVFAWHGLMGYTKNGIRLIGPEPENSALLYNLGCNGVGILPSIYGGKKIARHIAGETVERSIFDVPRLRASV